MGNASRRWRKRITSVPLLPMQRLRQPLGQVAGSQVEQNRWAMRAEKACNSDGQQDGMQLRESEMYQRRQTKTCRTRWTALMLGAAALLALSRCISKVCFQCRRRAASHCSSLDPTLFVCSRSWVSNTQKSKAVSGAGMPQASKQPVAMTTREPGHCLLTHRTKEAEVTGAKSPWEVSATTPSGMP